MPRVSATPLSNVAGIGAVPTSNEPLALNSKLVKTVSAATGNPVTSPSTARVALVSRNARSFISDTSC